MSKAVHPSGATVKFQRTHTPDERARDVIENHHKQERDGQEQFVGAIFKKADESIPLTAVSRFIVMN